MLKHHLLERDGVIQLQEVHFTRCELAGHAYPAHGLRAFGQVPGVPNDLAFLQIGAFVHHLHVFKAYAQEDVFAQVLLDAGEEELADWQARHFDRPLIEVNLKVLARLQLVRKVDPTQILPVAYVAHLELPFYKDL